MDLLAYLVDQSRGDVESLGLAVDEDRDLVLGMQVLAVGTVAVRSSAGTLAFDEGRLAEVDALLEGHPFEPTPDFEIGKALGAAAGKDPQMLRALLDIVNVLALPDEVFGRPGVFERVVELGGGWRDEHLPGPSRDELIALVS